jgi:hypothetical protein
MKLRRRLPAVCVALVCAGAAGAWAQSTKPGLWEIQQKMGGSPKMDDAMAKMEKQLAAMPPEQRKMMQDMLAKQGVGMAGAAPGGGMLVKVCITKEMAERQQMPSQAQGDCTTTITEKSASSMKMNFSCKNPPSSGEGVYTFMGDSAYTMHMKMNSMAGGAPQATTMDATGKWVASDCGSVKPVAAPAR